MAGMLRVHRRRGALSGVLLILLGLWGGLAPLIGPYFHYAYKPDSAWSLTAGRFWLEVAPAIGVLAAGLVVLLGRIRPVALIAAALAVLSGAWLAFGSALARIWMTTLPALGTPVGTPVARTAEQIGLFTGLGAVIICVASVALGRLSVVSRRDLKAAEPPVMAQSTATAATQADAAKGAGTKDAAPVMTGSGASSGSAAKTNIWRKVASARGTDPAGSGAESPAREGAEPVGSGTSRS